jgi:hypothetical protein
MSDEEKDKILKLLEKAMDSYADNETLEAEGYMEEAIALIEDL